MSTKIKAFESSVTQSDQALVALWKDCHVALKKAKLKVGDAEAELTERAKQKRTDFALPFTLEGKMSRTVLIDGAEHGKLNVTCEAVFKVQADLGENAKEAIDAYIRRFRKRMCLQLGEENVEDLELNTRIMDALSGRAALSSEAVNKLRKIPITAKHSKALRDGVKAALESLRPLESRVKVKEVK